MRIRTFNAPDMQAAMQMVRDTMGEEAIILSSSKEAGGSGISITAATEHEDEFPVIGEASYGSDHGDGHHPAYGEGYAEPRPVFQSKAAVSGSTQTNALQEIQNVLRFHNVPAYLEQKIMDTARYVAFEPVESLVDLKQALSRVLEASFAFSPIQLNEENFRMILVGPPGIGKTMTIAKMAARIVMERKKVTVITTDNKRAGGVEQLSAFTSILGIDLKVASSRTELRLALRECAPNARVLIDSAGSNPYDYEELKELGEYVNFEHMEAVLVAAAGGDCGEAEEIARAFSFLGARRLLVTRADTARRFGSILTTASVAELAFCNISSSSRVIGEFAATNAGVLAELLTKYKLEI